MFEQLNIGDFEVDVIKKDIKNIHLSVHPPTGRVRISAPEVMDMDIIRAFALTKLDWIKRNYRKLVEQERETKREYIAWESHYVWGKRYLLQLKDYAYGCKRVNLSGNYLTLYVREGEGQSKRGEILEAWYREQVREAAQKLMPAWEQRLGVKARKLFIRRMRSRWGSCNPDTRHVRLNTELVHKPKEALEFVLVHELLHLLEPKHNDRFHKLMDQHLPKWRTVRQQLNELPLSYAVSSHVKPGAN